MKRMFALACLLAGIAPFAASAKQAVRQPEVLQVWPGAAPGTESWTGPEDVKHVEAPDVGQFIVRTNITIPTLSVFRPKSGKATKAAMLVAPGGGFQVLAWDMEGLEAGRWLAGKGITAFVLKYRVRPFMPMEEMGRGGRSFDEGAARLEPGRIIAVADAMQALRLIRANAGKYGFAPDKVGMMGFSAGAMTTMGAVLAAQPSDRPNFAAPIYGAMPPTASVPFDAPPLFIAAAQDDAMVPVTESIEIFDKWTATKRPAELHLYQMGGHGFGIRKRGLPVDNWTLAFETWLGVQIGQTIR